MLEKTYSRRFVVTGLALLALDTACQQANGNPDKGKDSPVVQTQRLALSNTLEPGLVKHFGLEKIANVPATVHSIRAGGIPTLVYLYGSSVEVNPAAFESAYNAFGPRGLAEYTRSLAGDQANSIRFIPSDRTPIFRYNYGQNNEKPIEVGIFPASPFTKARHMLFLSDQLTPDWAKPVGAITRHYIPPGSRVGPNNTFLTIISPDVLARQQEGIVALNNAVLTEMCQQSVFALSVDQNNSPATGNSIEGTISQEGVCNGLGLAATLKRLRLPIDEALNFVNSTVIDGINGSPPMRLFPTSRLAYATLPDNGPLVGIR